MKKLKKAIFMTIEDEDGNIIEEIPMTAADDDWMRAGRLRKKADEGDQEAAEELRKMQNTEMFYFEEDDEEE